MNNFGSFFSDTMSKLKELVDVDTIVGKPIETSDGTTLIPVSKVTFGYVAGGTENQPATSGRAGAANGTGVSITPIAFIVISNGNVRMIYVDPPSNTTVDKIIDLMPEAIDKIKSMTNKAKSDY